MTNNSIFLLTQDVPTSEYLQKANSWDLRYSFLQCLDQYAENPTKNNHSEFQIQSENTLTICDQKGAVEWKIVLSLLLVTGKMLSDMKK